MTIPPGDAGLYSIEKIQHYPDPVGRFINMQGTSATDIVTDDLSARIRKKRTFNPMIDGSFLIPEAAF